MNAKERLAGMTHDSIGGMMIAYAQEAVRVAWSDHRQRLDLSESSIALLEAILAGQSDTDLEFQTKLWGGYFGEVLRALFGGEWEMTEYPGAEFSVPTLCIAGSNLYPLIKVHRRLTVGESESLTAFYQMVAARLKKPLAN